MTELVQMLKRKYMTGVQIRETIQVLRHNSDGIDFYHGAGISLRKLAPAEIDLIMRLRKGLPLDELEKACQVPRIAKVITLLDQRDILKTACWQTESSQRERLDRQIEWLSHFTSAPVVAQADVSRKRVFILGCGGTGSLVAQHLSHAGVRDFVLLDSAHVDQPDLNRQLPYTPAQIGMSKTSALSQYLRSRDESATAVELELRIESAETLADLLKETKPDLLVCGADTPVGLIGAWAAEAAETAGVPVLYGSVGLEDATVGPLLVSREAKRRYADSQVQLANRLGSDAFIMKSSICFTNTIASTLLAFEAFRYLSGIQTPMALHKTLDWNLSNMVLQERRDWSR